MSNQPPPSPYGSDPAGQDPYAKPGQPDPYGGQAPGQPSPYGQGGYQPAPGAAPGVPAAPGQLSQSDERMWSMLGHLGGILLGFVAPLIVMLVQGPKSAFVRRHSVEALNFQITLAIATFGSLIIGIVLLIVLIGIIFILLAFVIYLVGIVFMIIAGLAANKGEEYRYPFALRLVK